jgi:hypothetical protein
LHALIFDIIRTLKIFREQTVQQPSEPKILVDTMAVTEDKAQVVSTEEKSQPPVAEEVKVEKVDANPLVPKTDGAIADAKAEDKTPSLIKLEEKSVVVTKIEDVVMSPSKAPEVSAENSVVLSPPRADQTMLRLEEDVGRPDVVDDDMTSHYTEMGDEQSVFSHSETTLPPGADLPRVNMSLRF